MELKDAGAKSKGQELWAAKELERAREAAEEKTS